MRGAKDGPDQRDRAGAGDPAPRLADGQFYRALASSQRRRLLFYLEDSEESTVEELASVLSGWEATATGTMQTPSDRSAVRLQLLHTHLPRLADADLIEYDADTGTVRVESLHPRVTELVRQSIEAERVAAPE